MDANALQENLESLSFILCLAKSEERKDEGPVCLMAERNELG